jgi:hypothetical protein
VLKHVNLKIALSHLLFKLLDKKIVENVYSPLLTWSLWRRRIIGTIKSKMVCSKEKKKKKKPWSRLIIPFGRGKGIVFVRVYNMRFTCLEHELYLSRLFEHLFEQDVKQHNYIANMTIIFFFFFTFYFIKKKIVDRLPNSGLITNIIFFRTINMREFI